MKLVLSVVVYHEASTTHFSCDMSQLLTLYLYTSLCVLASFSVPVSLHALISSVAVSHVRMYDHVHASACLGE